MKSVIIIITLLLLSFNKVYSDDVQVVEGLISRILGNEFLPYFNLQIQNNNNQEYFELSSSSKNSSIKIQADSIINLATGLNHYLKYYGQCSFTWTGDQCNLNPQNLPSISSPLNIQILSKYRYYMNVCTVGYSTVWWDWPRWEREIDWMALNGYNLPLAFNGQEYVWYQVFSKIGLSESEINQWLTGPAFLPWNRMGNMNQWAGNLTLGWMTEQRDLQIQILTRMREYGMQSVLPGFAGHVPEALSQYYPNSNIIQLSSWCGFNGTYYLNPNDPLFSEITKAFINTQNELYGTDHLYNFDPFNELLPPTNDTAYLKNCSQSMYQNLVSADPDAIWVLQGWFLVNEAYFWLPAQTEAFFSGVPIGKLLVLDLWSDVVPIWNMTNYYYGHLWVWNMLHNFGGRSGMYGKLSYISTNPIEARELSPNMVGTGLTPEAIEQNVIVYELMNEMSWRSSPPDLYEWIGQYVNRRYGKPNDILTNIWYDLSQTVFNCPNNNTEHGPPLVYICIRPQLNLTNNLYYDSSVVTNAWNSYLTINDPDIINTATFQFDLTEITTQALINLFMTTEISMNTAFYNQDLESFEKYSFELLNIIESIDKMVGTQEMLLLGNWTSRARATAPSNESTDIYEFNARNQLTLWGPLVSTNTDYAYKLWSGLIDSYYLPRWTLFIKQLEQSLIYKQNFNYTTFVSNCESLELNWNYQTNYYTTVPSGNALEISKFLNILFIHNNDNNM